MSLCLYHFPLSPFGRKLRLAIFEKELLADIVTAEPWALPPDLAAKHPARTLPILLASGDAVIAPSSAITEYLEETQGGAKLWPADPLNRAEARRLTAWFDEKFQREVTELVLYEKIYKRLKRSGQPDMNRIRAGLHNIRIHLDYVSYLSDRRKWLAGDRLTYADFAAAGHFSALDYTGDVPWSAYPAAKDWYQRLKSRPAFRALLQDKVPGVTPASHYVELDF